MAKNEPIPIEPISTTKKIIKRLLIGIVALILVFGSFYTVQSGERVVLQTFGRASMVSVGDGLHFKMPIVQSIDRFDIKTQKYESAASAASKDLQDVHTTVAVNYHIIPENVPKLFVEIGIHYEERVIQPGVQEIVKAVTAQYTAEELITHRSLVKENIQKQLEERLRIRSILVEDISITNFEFSPAFTEAIEAKVTAEQLKLKAERDLERVRVEAEQAQAKARGERDAAIAKAEGEAEAMKIVQQQLRNSPDFLQWMRIQKWDGHMPTVLGGEATVLVDAINPLTEPSYTDTKTG